MPGTGGTGLLDHPVDALTPFFADYCELNCSLTKHSKMCWYLNIFTIFRGFNLNRKEHFHSNLKMQSKIRSKAATISEFSIMVTPLTSDPKK